MEDRVKIHRWTEAGLGSVNTYWIETPRSVIVIDGPTRAF